jgi:uncharacterized membrane protein
MDVPYAILAFGAVFLGVLIAANIIKAHRAKEKIYYVSSLVCGLALLACISAFFLQFTLLILFMVVAFLISVASYPEAREHVVREADKQQRETNITEPLKARELLSWKGWYKLAFKWGIPKTMGLYIGFILGIVIPVFFGLYIAGLQIPSAYISTTVIMAILTVQFYQQIKKKPLKTT